jgi:hypothetical protein
MVAGTFAAEELAGRPADWVAGLVEVPDIFVGVVDNKRLQSEWETNTLHWKHSWNFLLQMTLSHIFDSRH